MPFCVFLRQELPAAFIMVKTAGGKEQKQDVTERLRLTNHQLYEEVKAVLEENKAERHIRGGMATKRKYKEHQN